MDKHSVGGLALSVNIVPQSARESNEPRLTQKEWEEENRQILERLKKEGRLPSMEDVEKALRPPKEEAES